MSPASRHRGQDPGKKIGGSQPWAKRRKENSTNRARVRHRCEQIYVLAAASSKGQLHGAHWVQQERRALFCAATRVPTQRTVLGGFSAAPSPPPNGLGMEKADAAGTPAALTAADTPATAARRRKAARLTGRSPPSPAPAAMCTHVAGAWARRSVGWAAGTNAMAGGKRGMVGRERKRGGSEGAAVQGVREAAGGSDGQRRCRSGGEGDQAGGSQTRPQTSNMTGVQTSRGPPPPRPAATCRPQ